MTQADEIYSKGVIFFKNMKNKMDQKYSGPFKVVKRIGKKFIIKDSENREYQVTLLSMN
jgi:sporulation protein YlmC with PRC-barrel domain